jgi:hypothetical protein
MWPEAYKTKNAMGRYHSAHGVSCCFCMNPLGAANLRMDRVRSGGRCRVHIRWLVH